MARIKKGQSPLNSARLRAARAYLDLSMEDLARELGVTAVTVFHWERGRNQPGKNMRLALEKFLARKGLVVDLWGDRSAEIEFMETFLRGRE